jgi:hypothetical protein
MTRDNGAVLYNRNRVIYSNWGQMTRNSGTVVYNRSTVILITGAKCYVTAAQLCIIEAR